MQAPSMEELNYIWTTQGGETPLPYRLSAAYELCLVPIEPTTPRVVAGPVRAAVLTVKNGLRERDEQWQAYTDDTVGMTLSSESAMPPPPPDPPPPVAWLPVALFAAGGNATTRSQSVPPATASVDLLVVGPAGEQVGVTVKWVRQDGTHQEQPPQFHLIDRARIEDATPLSIDLQNAADGDEAVLEARPAEGGNLVPDLPSGNSLTLRVEAG
jgi:hypothetical protein